MLSFPPFWREESNNNNSAEEDPRPKKRHRSRSRDDPRSSKPESKSRREDRKEDRRKDDRHDRKHREERVERGVERGERVERAERPGKSRRRRSPSKERRRSSSRERARRSGSKEKTRSGSKERRRSRSPRRDDRRRRSTSKDRASSSRYNNTKRFDRTSSKIAQLEKLGIELPKYYNPAAMNPARYADQIQKRRLLWQKKETPAATATATQPVKPLTTGKVWEQTTFAQDSDGKVASKFKRLMGIKENPSTSTKDGSKDILKKQEEMFSSMEQQYEVARTATHTMRGVGLGFGTFNNYSR